MLARAGQTAGPNWLTFFEGIPGWPGSSIGYKNLNFFVLKSIFFFSRHGKCNGPLKPGAIYRFKVNHIIWKSIKLED